MIRRSVAYVVGFTALLLPFGSLPAAASGWGHLAGLAAAAPVSSETASFWGKPYPYGYRWRRTPCYVYVPVEPVVVHGWRWQRVRVPTCR